MGGWERYAYNYRKCTSQDFEIIGKNHRVEYVKDLTAYGLCAPMEEIPADEVLLQQTTNTEKLYGVEIHKCYPSDT